jgi:hypothetical protein
MAGSFEVAFLKSIIASSHLADVNHHQPKPVIIASLLIFRNKQTGEK